MFMSGRSQSFLTHPPLLSSDEDADEVPALRIPRRTESTCASPHLYRPDRSYLSSFASVLYKEGSEEDSPPKLGSNLSLLELQSEAEIRRIKRESDDAKDQLRDLARSLQTRAEEVRSSSVLSCWEAKARKDYLGRLCERLDTLLEDTHETEALLSKLIGDVSPQSEGKSALKRSEASTSLSLELRLHRSTSAVLSSKSIECAMEGPEKSKLACCSFIRN
jgi:hypothetical protein